VTARLDRRSDSQGNAEAAAKSAYRNEYHQSRPLRLRPRGLIDLLHWFEAEWHDQAPDDLHRFDVWREYVNANEQWKRLGGGSRLGTPAWSEGMRRLLEAPKSQDTDGWYVHPLAAAMRTIERRDGYMATFLRAVALAGFSVSPVGLRCGLPESVTMIYANEALDRLWKAYRDEAPARLLTDAPTNGVSSAAGIDEASPPTDAGPTASAIAVRRNQLPSPTLRRIA